MPNPKLRVIKIFLVGNRPMILAGLRAMVKASDIQVVGEAGTADDALRLVKRRTPHIVVLSDEIRDAGGREILCRIKMKWPKVSIIMVMKLKSPLNLSQALALGCSGCLREDVERKELLKAVRAVARGECVVEPLLLRKLLVEVARQRVEDESREMAMLTVSGREVLRLITEGQTNRQIAQRLGYSLGTVKDYVQKIIHKLEVSDRT